MGKETKYPDFEKELEYRLAGYIDMFEDDKLPPDGFITTENENHLPAVIATNGKGVIVAFAEMYKSDKALGNIDPRIEKYRNKFGNSPIYGTRLYVAPQSRNSHLSRPLLTSLAEETQRFHDERDPFNTWFMVEIFMTSPPGSDLARKKGRLAQILKDTGYEENRGLWIKPIPAIRT